MAGIFSRYNLSFCVSFFSVIHFTQLVHGEYLHNGVQNRKNAVDSLPSGKLTESFHFQNENILHPGERIAEKIKNNLFVVAAVSKTECFVGEPLIVTYKLYSRLNAVSSIAVQPALNGFSKTELIKHVSLNKSTEVLGGKLFQVHILRKTKLIPLIPGTLEVDGMEMAHTVNFIKPGGDSADAGNQLSDLLDRMKREERSQSLSVTINTHSTSMALAVRELPLSNKPPDFSGAIGQFGVKVRPFPKRVTAFEKLKITVEISGKGDLSLIDNPSIQFPDGIESFNVKRVETPKRYSPDFSTGCVFEYLIVPQKTGYITIPAVSFSYFDPLTKSYKTVQTMPINIQVDENPKRPVQKAVLIPKPIKTIKVDSDFKMTRKASALILVFVIAASIALFWKKLYKILQNIITGIGRNRSRHDHQSTVTPLSRAAERLKAVKEKLERKDFSACYYELNKTLWDVLTEKLKLLPAELSKGNILAELSLKGWTPEDKWNLELTMNEYERNLYIPGYQEEGDYEAAYNKALHIIAKLDELN